jgi:hypothetical protein
MALGDATPWGAGMFNTLGLKKRHSAWHTYREPRPDTLFPR